MSEVTLRINGLTCGACERVIERTVQKFEGARVTSFDFNRGTIRIESSNKELKEILELLKKKGYHAWDPSKPEALTSEEPLDRVKEFISGILSNNHSFQLERSILTATVMVLAASLAIHAAASIVIGRSLLQSNLAWLLLGSIGIAMGVGSIAHIRSFGKQTCQTGMMAGMGIGMMLGFLAGALFGATSGMFVGSVLGIVVGMVIGAWAGTCCGNMGVLEGLMAGLMAGTMGAMLSVMMVFDHQLEFLVILWIVCAIILGGLSYMLFKENGPVSSELSVNPWPLVGIGVVLTILLQLIIFFGPKTAWTIATGGA